MEHIRITTIEMKNAKENYPWFMPINLKFITFVLVLSLSHVWLFVIPWTAARQALLYSSVSWRLLKFRSIESVMLGNHLILCRILLLLPSIFPSIRVFSNESALTVRWPKYCSFSFSMDLPMNIQDWFRLG